MTCSRNDVVLLPIPFPDLTSRKIRQAIVVGRKGTDLFVVPVSSVLSNTDFLLQEWQGAGLNVPSGVKAQLATVEERKRKLGSFRRRSSWSPRKSNGAWRWSYVRLLAVCL